jgi:hypothetical protein
MYQGAVPVGNTIQNYFSILTLRQKSDGQGQISVRRNFYINQLTGNKIGLAETDKDLYLKYCKPRSVVTIKCR